MGLAQTLGNIISAFDSAGKQNTQQDIEMQKIDVSNFWKQAQMTFDAGKFLTNTKISLDRMDMEERKRVFGAYDTTIDNISSQISADETLKSRETNQSVINMLNKRIKDNRNRRLRMEEVSEKLYPTERKMFDAGQAGYDIDNLQQEGNQLYGEDIDSKALESQKGGNGRQGGINQGSGQMVDKIPLSKPPVQRDNGLNGRLAKDGMLAKDDTQDIDALKKQVQDLIGEVQARLGDSQPLNIPGARLPFDPEGRGYDYKEGIKADEAGHYPSRDPRTGQILKGRGHPTYDKTIRGEEEAGYEMYQGEGGKYYSRPKDVPLTVAQREANKYIGEQGIKFEQEQYDRYMTSLTSKYKYLDKKGISIDDEIKTTETDILEKQKLIEWIDMMASTGRTRAWSPTDVLGTGIQQLMAKTVPGFESILKKPKSVKTAWGKRYSTDTTSIQNDIERAKIKIDELNQLSELYVPGGGIPSEAQEQIKTGMTTEQQNTAQRRSKIYGAYRQ